jgi:hypothetical protein
MSPLPWPVSIWSMLSRWHWPAARLAAAEAIEQWLARNCDQVTE